MKPREDCKSSWSPTGNLKSFTLTIPWNSAKLVKISPGICKYHTSHDVFSRCKSVHKMATEKSDDELIQHDNKMRIGTRSGKFRKVENPELSMAW